MKVSKCLNCGSIDIAHGSKEEVANELLVELKSLMNHLDLDKSSLGYEMLVKLIKRADA